LTGNDGKIMTNPIIIYHLSLSLSLSCFSPRALHHFFGWHYYVGVLMSLLSTMIFLAAVNYGMRCLEISICIFVAIMAVAIFVEMDFVSPDFSEIAKGWAYGFVDIKETDIFSLAGIIGSVVMPHNLYLHTAVIQTRSKEVKLSPDITQKAIEYCSIEPILPIIFSFFVNLAVISIAAESVYGVDDSSREVGLTDFCSYFQSLKGGCLLWAIALLAAGQSSAITTTYTGQYVMDGFLNIQLPLRLRATITRLVAITPCVIVSIMFPTYLNKLINGKNPRSLMRIYCLLEVISTTLDHYWNSIAAI
jgi:NRAMP (natural resistance-associated macrophage protein)-like metal ion transporter